TGVPRRALLDGRARHDVRALQPDPPGPRHPRDSDWPVADQPEAARARVGFDLVRRARAHARVSPASPCGRKLLLDDAALDAEVHRARLPADWLRPLHPERLPPGG